MIYLPFDKKKGRKRPLDTPRRMIESKKGRRRDIKREGEIERGERDRESEKEQVLSKPNSSPI